jgi:hypothetical protein
LRRRDYGEFKTLTAKSVIAAVTVSGDSAIERFVERRKRKVLEEWNGWYFEKLSMGGDWKRGCFYTG